MNIFKILTLTLLVNEGVATESAFQDPYIAVGAESLIRCDTELCQDLKRLDTLAKEKVALVSADEKIKKMLPELKLAYKNFSDINKELSLEIASESVPLAKFDVSGQRYQMSLLENLVYLKINSEIIPIIYKNIGLEVPKESLLLGDNLNELRSSNFLTSEGAQSSLNLLAQLLENTDAVIGMLVAFNEKITETLEINAITSTQISQRACQKTEEIKVFADIIRKCIEGQ